MLLKKVDKLMGNRFEFTVIGQNECWCAEKIDLAIDEIKRIKE